MNKILDEVMEKHGEYIEMYDVEHHSSILIAILSDMIMKERDNSEYLKKRLDYECRK